MITRVLGSILGNRDRMPVFVRRALDDIAQNPDGLLARVAGAVLRIGVRRPAPTAVPTTDIRVYIGPTNYAGQGREWAAALDDAGIGARNMGVALPGGFAFPADSVVPVGFHSGSRAWQRAERDAVLRFTHVLVEAERPLFGSLYGRELRREVAALDESGLSVAFICHGADIRSPRRHLAATRWSPFADDPERARTLQRLVDANFALLEDERRPTFVSTPDLLDDVPFAEWCPVVVDPARWAGGVEPTRDRPVVVHIPSSSATKGSQLVDPVARALHDRGVIEYRRLAGVPSSEMPGHIRDADIVLDQFRIGSYGVAACEAMAAGRVVVGSVLPATRDAIRDATGTALPIVEADPDDLEAVLLDLVADHDARRLRGADGVRFVAEVHDGRRSVEVLRRGWLDQAASTR